MAHDPDRPTDRLRRIEEAQAFNERLLEQLSAQIAALSQGLTSVQAQVRRVEARLTALTDRSPRGEEPGDG